MPFSASDIDRFLAPLVRGWSPTSDGVARIFANQFAKSLACEPESINTGNNLLTFRLDLSRIRLRGSDQVQCILVGGAQRDDSVKTAARANSVPGRIILILAPGGDATDVRLSTLDLRRSVLDRSEIKSIMEASNSVASLQASLLRDLPKESLIPYDFTRWATGGMFFGRAQELQRLRNQDSTSFGIAGPGRAGKTSLLRRYHYALREQLGPLAQSTVVIDLMELYGEARTALGYANFISNKIEPKQDHDNISQFLTYLRRKSGDGMQPLNLVLDEADDLCLDKQASSMLANAVRHNYIRLILAGRADVLRTMKDPESHFALRLQLMRLGPLDRASARRLVFDPLEDLGISLTLDESLDRILNFTGCFPYLIQLYSSRIAEYAIQHRLTHLDPRHLDWIENSDEQLQRYCLSPLQDFRAPHAKLLALAILRDEPRAVWTPAQAAALVEGLRVETAHDLCDELVISNVLTWEDGSFRLAHDALRSYVRRGGYLENLYHEALKAYNEARKGEAPVWTASSTPR